MKKIPVHFLISIQTQIRILHWQTNSESRHRAYGMLYEKLDEKIDSFVESAMGKYKRFKLEDSEKTIKLENSDKIKIIDYLNKITIELINFNKTFSSEEDSDLLNIRDEILGLINKIKYIISFKNK